MEAVSAEKSLDENFEVKNCHKEGKNMLTVLFFRKALFRFVKRSFDIIASLFGLIFLSPVFLITAIAIKFEDGGPVIHRRYCVGKNGTYTMYKFRSMRVDANDIEKLLSAEQLEEYRKECKVKNDPRITKIGKIIRRYSIDELPQLLTVLKGDMSLVGPRPIVEFETVYYGKLLDVVLSVRPGMTGYWQVNGRSDVTYESGKRQKLELYYATHQSIKLDLEILLKTIKIVIIGEGAR